LKIPASRIRVIQTITQSWGDRGALKPHNFIAALLAVKTRRPVKLEYTIEEQLGFGAIHGKAATVQRVKVGVKKDGTLTAIKVSTTAQSGAFVTMYGDPESCMMWIYHCPNVLHEGRAVFTNTREYGSVRCLMHPVGTLPLELHMDTVAEKLGMDPV
jgi:CO/xanthine dehydrogenase Mo-binding subunit